MNNDFNSKLKDLLANENIQNNLMGLISLMSGNNAGNPPREANHGCHESHQCEAHTHESTPDENIHSNQLARDITNAIGKLGGPQDSRAVLLNALKPFLSRKRQEKLDGFMKILHLSKITRLMDNTAKEED